MSKLLRSKWFLKGLVMLFVMAFLIPAMNYAVKAATTTGYDRGYAGGRAGYGKVYAHGIDVSSWQGSYLNFQAIKNAGYDYVILRCGTTYGKDSCFESNYTRAKAAGLDVGVYYYSYATSISAAKSDANNCLNWINGKKFEYPIYFDYEDPSQDWLSQTASKNICLTFMDAVAAKGYLVGLYTGEYKSKTLLMSQICNKYEFWVANYYDNTYTSLHNRFSTTAGMYQYTCTKYISGIGPLDTNVAYKDYPSIVKKYGFNGYSASTGNTTTQPTYKNVSYSGSASYNASKYYTALKNVKLTGNQRVDIVNIARSQVGYQEGNNSYQLGGTYKGSYNYTEYGREYGLQDHWCAMFVSWCAKRAEVPNSVVLSHAWTPSGLQSFINQGRAYSRWTVANGGYTPEAGDIIYFNSSYTYNTNHIGIVTGYSNGTIYTIEGNTSSATVSTNGGAVCEKAYSIYNTYIVYVCSPNYSDTSGGVTGNVVVDQTGELYVNQNLYKGYSGNQVKYLQYGLKAFGYYTDAIDGEYGDNTFAAVKAYQKANGLTTDGIAGPNTLTSLVGTAKELQTDLSALGYYKETVDGILGDASISAIKAFQSANGITANGVADANTLEAIQNKLSTTTGVYYAKCASSHVSIIDALNSIGVTYTWDLHKKIASANGISNFSGTAEQNIKLLGLLKSGKLIKPGNYYPQCASSHVSIIDALTSVGVNYTWDLHKQIAAANGISDFSGTAEQNIKLLGLLKNGILVKPGSKPSGGNTGNAGSTGSTGNSGNNGSTGNTGSTVSYYPACASSHVSIMDALKSVGVTYTWETHKQIAAANGISNFTGTPEQNIKLLDLLKAGKLKKPTGTTSTVSYYPACASSHVSIMDALKSVGVTYTWDLHKQIAAANGISNFTGTPEQNIKLLDLLKAGKLIKP